MNKIIAKGRGSHFSTMTKEQRQEMIKKALETRRKNRENKNKIEKENINENNTNYDGRCSVMKAIRFKCLDCSNLSPSEVANCDIYDCSLWEFRFGRKPKQELISKVRKIKILGKDK